MPLFRKEYRHALSEPFEMVLKDRTFAESRTCIYVFLHTDFRYSGIMFAVKREEARPFIEKLADPRIAFWNWRKSYDYGTKITRPTAAAAAVGLVIFAAPVQYRCEITKGGIL